MCLPRDGRDLRLNDRDLPVLCAALTTRGPAEVTSMKRRQKAAMIGAAVLTLH